MPLCPSCQQWFHPDSNNCPNCKSDLMQTQPSESDHLHFIDLDGLQPQTFFSERYYIIERIGTGGYSDVFKAEDQELNEIIALKVLKADFSQDNIRYLRFKNEIKFARKIKHPNVCTIYDIVVQYPYTALSMEYLDGIDLSKCIPDIPESKRISIFIGLSLALKAAHNINVVHCDLKPSNIMIDETSRPIIMDFGIARYLGSTTTGDQSFVVGTPAYMSPEQFTTRSVDHRTDIYSLGVIMFELLTGDLPFFAISPTGFMLKHTQKPVSFPSEMKKQLDPVVMEIILKCLEKKPDDRYQSMDDLLKDLQKLDSTHPRTWEPARKPLILVVDDDKLFRKSIENFLELKNFEILSASDGEEGVRMAIQHKPDLILIDLVMPNMDGFASAQILGKNSVTAHIPILLLTSVYERERKAFSRTIGIKEYLTKPCNFDELLNKIYLHLSLTRF